MNGAGLNKAFDKADGVESDCAGKGGEQKDQLLTGVFFLHVFRPLTESIKTKEFQRPQHILSTYASPLLNFSRCKSN